MTRSTPSPGEALRDVPPREFISARRTLAARLAREGRPSEARAVARLRRPSPVVWALNRTALARPREVRALANAVDRLRRAQLGRGDLRASAGDYRAAFDPLVRAAVDVLTDAGTRVSAAVDRRIRSTLLAAVTDRGLRTGLQSGGLSEERPDPGFTVLTGDPVPADFLRSRPKSKAPPPAETRRLARRQARNTREAARHARALERKAERAERAAARAERRVEALRRSLRALEDRSAALRAAAEEARKACAGRGKILGRGEEESA
jgi:hypothetical protein